MENKNNLRRSLLIKGSHYQTGFLLGNLHKEILKKIEKEVSGEIKVDYERIKIYEVILNKFSDIREEIEGYCNGSDIKFENLLKLKLGNFKIPKFSCTSLYISSDFTDEKIPVCMKIRDEKPLPQYICKKKNGNKMSYFFSGSISDIGYGFFIKENGFLGINNTGSFLKERFLNEHGFDDCDLMRIIAENCNDPEEALENIKKMQKEKMISYTGKKRGMIFLLVNKEKAFFVEINSFDLNYRKVKGKFGFTNDFLINESRKWVKKEETEGTKSSRIRKKRLDEIFEGNKTLNLEKLMEISRDKKYYPYSICRDTSLMSVRTISSFIVLYFKNPVVWINVGNPYISPYFLFDLRGNYILKDFITGEVSLKLNLLFEKKKLEDEEYLNKIRDFEKNMKEKFVSLEDIEEKNIRIQEEVYGFIFKEEAE